MNTRTRFNVEGPLAEKMQSWSVYNYVFNNPIMLVDPDGRNPDVYVDGPDADKAVEALNQGSKLGIKRDSETGKLSASGTASNPAEKMLLKAISDTKVDVHLETTKETKYLSTVKIP